MTQRRGGALALTAIAREAGPELPERVGALWDAMWLPLQQLKADSGTHVYEYFEVVAYAFETVLLCMLQYAFSLNSCLIVTDHIYLRARNNHSNNKLILLLAM